MSDTPTTKINMMTFDRWFASTGRPPRHKAGMKAFTDTKGKKTVEAWNKIFKKY
jgi:hypothetical protein